MRRNNEQIKQLILHPLEEIRSAAIEHFAYQDDPAIMPVMIEAVEQFGREQAFGILRSADKLAQSAESVSWLIEELQQDYDLSEIVWNNYRFALALVLCNCDPGLLLPQRESIVSTRLFPEMLVSEFEEHLELYDQPWRDIWDRLVANGEATLHSPTSSLAEIRHTDRLINALGNRFRRSPEEWADYLKRDSHADNPELADMLKLSDILIAGTARQEAMVPMIVGELFDNDDYWLRDRCLLALRRLGSDSAIDLIVERFHNSDEACMSYAAEALGLIPSAAAVEACRQLALEVDDIHVATTLARSWIKQFDDDAIEPVRQLLFSIQRITDADEVEELKLRLVTAALAMGVHFPELSVWQAEMETINWGWYDYVPSRLSESFFEAVSIDNSETGDPRDGSCWDESDEMLIDE